MKTIFIILFLFLSIFAKSQSCEYTLRFIDSYGDGWTRNMWDDPNAYQNIDINGSDFADLYLSDDYLGVLTLSLSQGDFLEITYIVTSLTWEDENSFELVDCLGNIVWSGGGDGSDHYYSETIDCYKCILPVEFNYSFYDCSRKKLYWSTITEINNDFFTVNIGHNYNDLELNVIDSFNIVGSGNSNEINEYALDLDVGYDLMYIEIWQTDYNKTTSIVGPKLAVKCYIEDESKIEIYPNPAINNDKVFIKGDYDTIQIFDMAGREIYAKIAENKIIGLSTGMYIIVIDNIYKIKLIIKS